MNRLIILLLIGLSALSVVAEDFYTKVLGPTACFIDYKGNEIEIPEEPMNIDVPIQKVVSILNKDIFGYYDLTRRYTTPLQQSEFKKSQEYRELSEAFNQTYKNCKDCNFYILYNLHDNTAFDVSSKCFKFKIGINDYNTTTKPGYLGLGNNICLSYPTGKLKIRKTLTRSGSDYWFDQYITTPKISEELAMSIEHSMAKYPCPISLLFIVKLGYISTEKRSMDFGGNIGRQTITNQFIMCKTVGLYIVNIKTNEVICDLSSILTPTSVKKK